MPNTEIGCKTPWTELRPTDLSFPLLRANAGIMLPSLVVHP